MLRVKSFDMKDDEGINKLLESNRLASGAHILVSEGKVIIPYEDGQPETPAQTTVRIQEEKNTLITQRELIKHSQGVMGLILADAEDRFNVADADWKKNKSNKALEAKKIEAENGVRDAKTQIRGNEFELVRIQRNLDLFDEQVAQLRVYQEIQGQENPAPTKRQPAA